MKTQCSKIYSNYNKDIYKQYRPTLRNKKQNKKTSNKQSNLTLKGIRKRRANKAKNQYKKIRLE